MDDQPVTVLEVRRDYIRIAVSKSQSRKLDYMQRQGAACSCSLLTGTAQTPQSLKRLLRGGTSDLVQATRVSWLCRLPWLGVPASSVQLDVRAHRHLAPAGVFWRIDEAASTVMLERQLQVMLILPRLPACGKQAHGKQELCSS